MSLLASIIDPLLHLIDAWGYLGIFVLMTIESSVLPVPSEAIMIPAGALAAAGQMNIILAFIAGVAGNVLGAVICYYIAFFVGRKGIEALSRKYGKYIFVSEKSLAKSDDFFNKYGNVTVFFARLIPGIRHLISLPAGFSEMNLGKFCLYTAMGSSLWNIVLLSLGFVLGKNSALIARDLKIFTIGAVVLALLVAAIYWCRLHKKRKAVKAAA